MRMRQEEFDKFDNENPDIWNTFEKLTLEAIKIDHRNKFSAHSVIYYIRWDTMLHEKDEHGNPKLFKINDHVAPFYARKFMNMHKEHDGFFETREKRDV